jgi:hypothetical protein
VCVELLLSLCAWFASNSLLAFETSTQQRETSTKATSSRSAESNRESQSDDSGDSGTASNNSRRLKVAVAAALAEINYDFGLLGVMKAHVGSMENYARYFPKGYGRAPGVEFVPEPHANEVVIFEDFSLLGSVCYCIRYLQTFCTSFRFNCTI